MKEVLEKRAAMASQGALSIFIPENLTQVVLVPLAAVLIDYPVTYVHTRITKSDSFPRNGLPRRL